MFPILNTPPTSLWVIPVHQPQASCILHLDWQFVSYMILYMFQCHSPNILKAEKKVYLGNIQFSSVQLLSHVRLSTAHQASPSITNSRSSLKLMSIESVMPSSHLILCCPLLLLPPIPPSIGVFSNESALHMRWPMSWSFSFSIIPSKEHLGLISFRMDWLDLLAVQGTLKSLLQHHSSKHQFFGAQLSSQSNSHIHT